MRHISISKNFFSFFLAVGLLLSSSQVFAQDVTSVPTGQPDGTTVVQSGNGGSFSLTNPLSGVNSVGQAALNFVQIFSYLVVLLAVLMLIWVGFQYIMASAQGNADKIKDLHTYLLWIVIGVAVVIGARVIIQVVLNTLEATGSVNSGIIQSAKQGLQN